MASITLRPNGINNRQDPLRLGTIADPRDPVVSVLVQAENADLDNNNLATRRGGRTRRVTGATHSFWAHPTESLTAYLIIDSVLRKLNVDYTTTAVTTLSTNQRGSFDAINGEIAFTNGNEIGWLAGTTFTPFAPTLRTFEAAMPAGQHLAFDPWDGCLLVASLDAIYKSKPHYAEVRESRLSEFPMDGYVRMLAVVDGGWWVATEKHVGFVKRDAADGFTFSHIAAAPPPNGCFLPEWTTDTKGNAVRQVVWASIDGFCIGHADGSYTTRSQNAALPTGSDGCLYARNNNGTRQYVAVIQNPVGAELYTADALSINTITV